MFIEELSLVNFKNFEQAEMKFSPNLNCFIGNNGAGKTNLMDAIYYLSFCKSFLNPSDLQNIRHNEDFFVIQGKYRRQGNEENIYCGLKKGDKKHFKRNKKEYRKLSEHIGLLPLIVITPSDIDLIMGGSDERRKFVDTVISLYNHQYLDSLIRYNRALLQRNNLLKQFAATNRFQAETLDLWDDQLAYYAEIIHQERKIYIEKFLPVFQNYYKLISGGNEIISLEHQSHLYEGDFTGQLRESLPRDRTMQFTTVGIHKDDIEFKLGDFPIKKLGSQGQKKTFLVALKLAQYNFVKEISGITPILLLDDIFDKLDKHRVEQIVKLVANDHFGQIFITDTNREHLDQIISRASGEHHIFTIDNGGIAS
ncbi:MAG: DNA replication/repair protein RecF [Prolixibacteraceae bacterium]|jgi:DNA replication and repair protein RecF|nr:DNA replication/repair protein RecF [Prolixibacteraceae bacterium]